MPIKIISGGQTGVDQAALEAAIKTNLPYGGWCPKGRIAENGVIPDRYHLIETESKEYAERTSLNIRDSDGTLILLPSNSTQTSHGTQQTYREAQESKKPFLLVDPSDETKIVDVAEWVALNNIKILNIGGPRESESPGIYAVSLNFLMTAFQTDIFLQRSHLKIYL